jgi:hypothetical protein
MIHTMRLAAALVLTIVGCSSQSGSAPSGSGALIAPPAVGAQVASTQVTLDGGGEKYLCWSFKMPSAFSIIGTETGLPAVAVHHYAVFTSSSAVPADAAGYDCRVMDGSWGLVSGGGRGTPGLKFPDGVGMPLPAGQHIVFQLHLLNASSSPVTVPVAAINLLGSTATNLQTAGVIIAGNLDITLPAHSTGVKISGGCPAPWPLTNVFALFPHMHTLGTHISMTVTKQGTTTPDMLLDQSWDFGSQGVYPATGTAAQGDQIGVTCTFTNPGNSDVHFGESTLDEMCLGVLYYYPAQQASQYCGFSR